jgi:hypothetical protein
MARMDLDDPELFNGLPLPASPVTSGGEDPDEVRLNMLSPDSKLRGQIENGMRRVPPGASVMAAIPGTEQPSKPPSQVVAGAPTAPLPPAAKPASPYEDAARQGLTGGLSAANRLMTTGDSMQDDPQIKQLQSQVQADESGMPNAKAKEYRPGFGTRLLRGLKAAGIGAIAGGIPGLAAGALDPTLVGQRAYGAPNDSYEAALDASKRKTATDTESLTNAMANFKRQQDLRNDQSKTYNQAGEGFGKVTTGAVEQEGIPIRQQQADTETARAQTEAEKVFNESPEGKLQITQGQLDERTRRADSLKMPPGFMRTRFILTGEMQPGREATADELAVNRILQTYRQSHNGQGPATVNDWQDIYAAAKGGTRAAGGQESGNLRTAARIASARVKELQASKDKYGLMDTPEEAKTRADELQQAKDDLAGLQAQLAAGTESPAPSAGTSVPAQQPAAQPKGGAAQGGAPKMVRMRVPVPGQPGQFRFANFPEGSVSQAKALGAVEAPLERK